MKSKYIVPKLEKVKKILKDNHIFYYCDLKSFGYSLKLVGVKSVYLPNGIHGRYISTYGSGTVPRRVHKEIAKLADKTSNIGRYFFYSKDRLKEYKFFKALGL